MDLSKLSKGTQVYAAGALVYFIASFLPWFDFSYADDVFGLDWTANGWDLGFLWCGLWAIALLGTAVFMVMPAFGVALKPYPAVANLGVAALAAFFTVLKLLIGEEGFDRGYGLFLAAIAALAALYGAFTLFKDAGGTLDDLKDVNKLKGQFGASSGGHDGGTPPPPMPPPPPPMPGNG